MIEITRRSLLTTAAGATLLGPAHLFAASKTKRLEMGTPAPPFKLRSRNRHVHYLKDFAFAGKPRRGQTKHPVLLDFFRTDCEPCVRSVPELVRLHEAHHEQGLRVLMVAMHEEKDGRAKLRKYLDANPLPFLVVEDPTDWVAKRYLGETVSLPATFLIDEEGILKKAKYDTKKTMTEAFGKEIEALLAARSKGS